MCFAQPQYENRLNERSKGDSCYKRSCRSNGTLCPIQQQPSTARGERNAVRIEGFHLANSPFEYSEEAKDKTIIMTTTNGTRAIDGSCGAKRVVIVLFLNATAVANKPRQRKFRCSHCMRRFSRKFHTLEDALCAGMIAKNT